MAATTGPYYYSREEIDELLSGGSSTGSFMTKAVYDADDNGVVDNADKVNGHIVLKDVPSNAKFTDTTYTAGNGIAISNNVIRCTFAALPQGVQFNTSKGDFYNFLCTLDMSELASRTDFASMFANCNELTAVPLFDTSGATKMDSMFEYCHALTTVPLFNMSGVTRCAYMFHDCTALTSVPQFNMGNCTDPGAMFNGCSALVTMPQFDFSKVTSFGGLLSSTKIYNGCTSLSNDSLNNILASMAGATSYTGTKTLKFLGLTSNQATTCTGLSNYAAFTAAGWSTGY